MHALVNADCVALSDRESCHFSARAICLSNLDWIDLICWHLAFSIARQKQRRRGNLRKRVSANRLPAAPLSLVPFLPRKSAYQLNIDITTNHYSTTLPCTSAASASSPLAVSLLRLDYCAPFRATIDLGHTTKTSSLAPASQPGRRLLLLLHPSSLTSANQLGHQPLRVAVSRTTSAAESRVISLSAGC